MERAGPWLKVAEQVYHPRHLTLDLLPHTITPDSTEDRRGQGKLHRPAVREAPGSKTDVRWWARHEWRNVSIIETYYLPVWCFSAFFLYCLRLPMEYFKIFSPQFQPFTPASFCKAGRHWNDLAMSFGHQARASLLSDVFPHLSSACHPGRAAEPCHFPGPMLIHCRLYIRDFVAGHLVGILSLGVRHFLASSLLPKLRCWAPGVQRCQELSFTGIESETIFFTHLTGQDFPAYSGLLILFTYP